MYISNTEKLNLKKLKTSVYDGANLRNLISHLLVEILAPRASQVYKEFILIHLKSTLVLKIGHPKS